MKFLNEEKMESKIRERNSQNKWKCETNKECYK